MNDFNTWDNGFPYGGINDGTNSNGSMDFWDNGFPYQFIFATPGTLPNTSANFFFFFN